MFQLVIYLGIIFVVADGLGGLPLTPGGKTELQTANTPNLDKLAAELKERDNKDLTRSVGPLKQADDAVFIDSTRLSIDGVVEEMLKYIKK